MRSPKRASRPATKPIIFVSAKGYEDVKEKVQVEMAAPRIGRVDRVSRDRSCRDFSAAR